MAEACATPGAVTRRGGLQRVRGLDGAPFIAGLLAVIWLLVNPRSPDLAAQVYRVDLFRKAGFAIWDNNWYAGHHLPGYSLVFPPLAALVGLRAVGVVAVVASSVLFVLLVRGTFGPRTRLATAWFAVAAAGDLWIGRLTFALGVAIALAATLAAARDRRAVAALLAALCAATSPVAGLFLVFAGVAQALASRSIARSAALVLPAMTVVLALAGLFPEGGVQPFSRPSFVVAMGAAVAFVALMPRRERLLRVGGVLYAVAVLLSLIPITPMGSNVVRLGVMLAGPLLACALAQPLRTQSAGVVRTIAVGLAGLGFAVWTVNGPVVEALKSKDDPSVTAAYYAPALAFLARHAGHPVRVEVPFTRGHWESVFFGSRFPLARGWERQLDTKYDHLFGGPLTAGAYHRWLRDTAVSYVALGDAPLDPSSVAEARLVRRGLPFLHMVFRSRRWSIYAVTGHRSLATGPGVLTALGHDRFTLRANGPGTFTVRVRYTPYWTVTTGAGCVRATPQGWTAVTASRPGPLTVTARWSLSGALRTGVPCALPRATRSSPPS
jgi:hypothetical protein